MPEESTEGGKDTRPRRWWWRYHSPKLILSLYFLLIGAVLLYLLVIGTPLHSIMMRCIGYEDPNKRNDRVARNARPLQNALAAYRLGYGEYPDALPRLIPEFLDAVPSPRYEVNAWSYTRSKDDPLVYELEVHDRSGYGSIVYYSQGNEWTDTY